MQFDYNSLVSALVGGACTLVGVGIAHHLESLKQSKKEADEIKGVLNGVHVELETLWSTYIEKMGTTVEQLNKNEPLTYYWPVSQNYFVFYETNSSKIASIPDKRLQQQIVEVYCLLKSLIDSFRMNNQLLAKFDHAVDIHNVENTKASYQRMDICHKTLLDYANKLKDSHEVTSIAIVPLLRSLRVTC
ncbi:hypothetical protein L1D13_19055 [Vibrio tubiashii]|nr:hypothetical protein [Vibrio tubiashii]MCG9582538.1 hypothetical protein [Vibrio tubiashii]MCG9616129.1 hypothetical protein [Vibrio tubiashii]MCG9689008.1 hypothetical protein [Vibrio tubiashii]